MPRAVAGTGALRMHRPLRVVRRIATRCAGVAVVTWAIAACADQLPATGPRPVVNDAARDSARTLAVEQFMVTRAQSTPAGTCRVVHGFVADRLKGQDGGIQIAVRANDDEFIVTTDTSGEFRVVRPEPGPEEWTMVISRDRAHPVRLHVVVGIVAYMTLQRRTSPLTSADGTMHGWDGIVHSFGGEHCPPASARTARRGDGAGTER